MTDTARPTRPRRVIIAAGVAVVLVVGIAVGAFVWSRSDSSDWAQPTPTAAGADDALRKFYTQQLDWKECGRAWCAEVTVPVDYAEPAGETLQLAMRVYPSADGRSRRSLLVNPGGPGGSALDYAASLSGQLGRSVTDLYDVVGVDPRGVGRSTPLQCLDDEQFSDFIDTDPDPDDSAEITDLRRETTDMGDACAANSGELASHVSTEEVARDMDVVRGLLGRDQLDWFGASYGTQIGSTYANVFPERVGRMVLDGAVDPAADPFESVMGQVVGFQRAFDAYAADCVKNEGCPLGDSVADARRIVIDLIDGLDADPLPTSTDRELTEGQAFYGLALPLYSEQSWSVLTQALTQALAGDGTTLQALSDVYFERDPNGAYDSNVGQVIYAVNCLDAADQPTLEEVEARLPEFEQESPVFGRTLGWGALSCTDWPLKSTTPVEPVTAAGAAPIVVVGTTRDPATPYENSVNLAKALESGVLLSRDGDGHTAYNQGNACIDDAIDAYLVEGTVPKDGTECAAE